MAFIVFAVLFIVLFLIGMPVGFAMISASVVWALMSGTGLSFFTMEMFAELNSFTLIAIPMFMLSAEVMSSSTVADRMFDVCNGLVGWIPGGLGHTNVLTSVIFAGMSGSAAADAGGIGYLCQQSMEKRGCDKAFSAACTAASSCIGPIIPPSIPVVVYAMCVSSASVGKMLMGGVIPGLLMALFMSGWIAYISIKRGYPKEERPTGRQMLGFIKRGFLPCMTPVVLLTTISTGMVTVSEGAVITVLYTIILGVFVYHETGIKGLIRSARNVFRNCGVTLIFFAGGACFSHVMAKENIPALFANAMFSITENPILLLMIVNIFFFLLGCLSDPTVNIMLFASMVMPVVTACGMDPNAWGVILILNCMIGLITPPVGTMVYIICGLSGASLSKTFKECVPFVGFYYLLIVILTIFPGIITFIPNLILG